MRDADGPHGRNLIAAVLDTDTYFFARCVYFLLDVYFFQHGRSMESIRGFFEERAASITNMFGMSSKPLQARFFLSKFFCVYHGRTVRVIYIFSGQ